MTLGVNVTPSQEAEAVLSQIAVSKLRLSRDVSLCGSSAEFWEFRRFYSSFGLLKDPLVACELDIFRNEAISKSLASSSVLDRAAAALSDSVLSVERPGGDEEPSAPSPRAPGGTP
ncbi:hypothetical protein TALC_00401 [Thermoplasmatales archaeon BRNA1]|nr:hypothetical protein TALC_00401 [Thermoplasmatales archaeon BRNA1]